MTTPAQRSDARRNRDLILSAAREAFGDAAAPPSNAEICRRAGVGMATLYRNFPTRLELLEALYAAEADAAFTSPDSSMGSRAAFEMWLQQFVAFAASKKQVAAELLTQVSGQSPIFNDTKTRVMAVGQPLLDAAVHEGLIRNDLSLEQILQLLVAVATIENSPGPLLRTVLDGLMTSS